jgi:DNA-binding CsgD family transcriptional regulator
MLWKGRYVTPSLPAYDDLLHRVYDSALQPSAWPDTLEAVAKMFGARRVALWTFMHGVENGGICFTYNLDQSVMEAWAQVSPAEDPFVQVVVTRKLLVDGTAYTGDEMVPREQLVQSRLYRDIWVPLDIAHLCSGTVFAGTDGRQLPTALSLYRSPRDPAFDADEVGLLRRLLAHFSRALGVMFHLQDQAHQVAASRAALNRLGVGVVLLDAMGGIQFENELAERLLRLGDMVKRVPRNHGIGKVAAALPQADRLASASRFAAVRAAFAKAVASAIKPYAASEGEHFSEAVVLPDQDGKPALIVNVAPLGQGTVLAAGSTPATAIVFLCELTGRGSVTVDQLRTIFGMTPAEALAAMQLLEAGSAQDMANRLNISVNTFKTQIKAAYAKTNTNRQSGLLRLMLSLGPA